MRSATDGRATDALLTDAGWETLTVAAPRHVARVREAFFADISIRQQDELADILSTVYENILRVGTLPRPESN